MGILKKLLSIVTKNDFQKEPNTKTGGFSVSRDDAYEGFSGQKTCEKPVVRNPHKEPVIPDPNAIPSKVSNVGSTAYFIDLIRKNLPDVEIRQNIGVEQFGVAVERAHVKADIVLFDLGSPTLAILVVHSCDACAWRYIHTLNAFEEAGIPAIRFITELDNKPGYVIGRIKAVMK